MLDKDLAQMRRDIFKDRERFHEDVLRQARKNRLALQAVEATLHTAPKTAA